MRTDEEKVYIEKAQAKHAERYAFYRKYYDVKVFALGNTQEMKNGTIKQFIKFKVPAKTGALVTLEASYTINNIFGEVKAALKEGDLIAVEGQKMIKDEQGNDLPNEKQKVFWQVVPNIQEFTSNDLDNLLA